MKLEKYTERARGFIQSSQSRALAAKHHYFTPEHLLNELLEDQEGFASNLVCASGGDSETVKQSVRGELARLPKVDGGDGISQLFLTPESARLFESAEQLAGEKGDHFVTAECLLLALAMASGTPSERMLKAAGVTVTGLEAAIIKLRKGRSADSSSADANYDAVRRYSRDITELAQDGKLDPVIGRDEEIRRTIQVLSRRTKNNPVLIGEPGVGKTAIVEGLATRMVNGDVPESLSNKRLLALDLGAMLAGAKFRGEFEERLKSLLTEVTSDPSDIVLFIDELHTLVGAGAAEGAMDASNLLKPALARGDLHCVGATTIDEYRKHIEKDAALARRFQSVFVPEPTVEDTISILRGLKEKYELHHGVDITDGAIVAAANLSERYIADRFLPDKAIDLIDEAASRKRMEMDSKPEEIDELDRRVIQLKIERGVLIKENDSASKDRLTELELELTASEGRAKSLSSKWQSEKESLHGAQNLKEQLDTVRNELEAEKRNGNYERAGELVHSVIPDLESQLYVFAEAHGEDGALMVSEKVVDDDIASVVSRSTGIPVDKIVEGEGDKLLQMETALAKRVVGQKDAVLAVSNAVRRARAGLQDPTRPIGSFMFLGPTGVGKTELCKALAEFLFDDEGAMLRIDMSEYMERHAVARLIGAPPGYVGYEEGGTLTETIRRRPYQLVLFDEVEKAHEDVFNVLLQLLDDGRLTDGQGRTANFTNTLVVMTSNLGSEILAQQGEDKEFETSRLAVMEMVRRSFRPEFLNRIDEMIVFKKLDRDQMTSIVRIQLDRLQMLLSTRRINIDVTGSAIKWLAEVGYDPVYGARPLKRVIQRRLQDPLARYLLEGTVKDGDQVAVAADDDGLRFDVAHLLAA